MSSRTVRRLSYARVVLWLGLIYPALRYGWADSTAFVSTLSLLALALSDFAAARADAPTDDT